MVKKLILLILLSATVFSVCPAINYAQNITTGMLSLAQNIQIVAETTSSLTYQQNYQYSFTSTPKIAFAITSFETILAQGIFSITPINITPSFVQFIIETPSIWQVNNILYWATTNPQLVIGTAIVYPQQNLANSSLYQASFNVQSPFQSSEQPIVRSFINGFSSNSPVSVFAILSSSLNSSILTINLQYPPSSNILNVLISYLAFSLSTSNFGAYGSYVPIITSNNLAIDVSKTFSSPQNIFYGLTTFNITPSLNPVSLTVSIDPNFIFTAQVSGSFNLIGIIYIFLGYTANLNCVVCSKSVQASYYYNGSCLNTCPLSTFGVTLSNGGMMCKSCSTSMNLVLSGNQCICQSNYQMVDGVCQQIISNSNNQQISTGGGTASNSISNPVTVASTATNPYSLNTNLQSNTQSALSTQSNQGSTITLMISTASSVAPNPGAVESTSQPTSAISSPTYYCPLSNSFWNGNQCVCFVGYIYQNSQCTPSKLPSAVITPTPTTGNCLIPNTYFNGQACVCQTGYFLIGTLCTQCPSNSNWTGTLCVCNSGYSLLNGICVAMSTICPLNSNLNGSKCVCNSGYSLLNNVCSLNCPLFSQNNGLGTCVCITNYTLINGSCTKAQICPPYSTLVNNNCVCNQGYVQNGNQCSRCLNGSYWSNSSNQCIYVCGANSQYSTTAKSCICLPGYGIVQNTCQACPYNYFISNGYCVTCPQGSILTNNNQCTCQTGYLVNIQGFCVPKCSSLQTFNSTTGSCQCLPGLVLINSLCAICRGTYYQGACIACGTNQVLVYGICQCETGFVLNSGGVCVSCSSISNGFQFNGYCATCPNNLIYNSSLGQCECSAGSTLVGNSCQNICSSDQLLDSQGNCYNCEVNQVISNGVCTCLPGYSRANSSCSCQLVCPQNYFIFQGTCAICPVGRIYQPQLNGCVCPNGQYLSPYNTCDTLPITINNTVVNCQTGSYLDNTTKKCFSCPSSCSSCQDYNNCSQCQIGYNLQVLICSPICGDGLIKGNQTCDTVNNPSPGCINCQIQPNYTCQGTPSVCQLIVAPTPPSLQLYKNISLNSNNVFVTLQTTPTFTFANSTQMENFIYASFTGLIVPTTYCAQQPSPHLNLFDCLMIYASGLPNNKFNVTFSFNQNGLSANTTISINPLAALSSSKK